LAHRQQAIAGSIDKTKALLNLGAREVKQQCNKTYSSSFKTHNACICGLGELATFLPRSAKKVTVYPSPARCTC